MPGHIIVLQHVACETLGTIAEALTGRGLQPVYVRPFQGQSVPESIDAAAGLVVMGGPMGVYEAHRYPFLTHEMRLIEDALHREVPVLGVCLGSQLLAATLGAAVTKGPGKEIGWHPVSLTDAASDDRLWGGAERTFTAFNWHGDILELPAGAVSLASSSLTANQAFRYGASAYGFLFHMEVTTEIIEGMVDTFADELAREGLDGQAIIRDAELHLVDVQRVGARVFDAWARLVVPEP